MDENRSKSLISIAQDMAVIESALVESGGEITADMEAQFDSESKALATKVDGCAAILDRAKIMEKFYKDEASDFAKLSKGFAKFQDGFKKYIKLSMSRMGEGKRVLQGVTKKITCSPIEAKLIVEDSDVVPLNFYNFKVTQTFIRNVGECQHESSKTKELDLDDKFQIERIVCDGKAPSGTKVDMYLDEPMVKQALIDGGTVPGCRLEDNFRLLISKAKGM